MTSAADQFLQRCSDSDQLPDVFKFLASKHGLPERVQVDVLLVDQFQRWKQNQVIPVDQYLDRTPHIRDVLKVDLLLEEYGYLEQRGIAPHPSEFAKRYAALSTEARQELHCGLEIEFLSDSFDSDSKSGLSESDKTTDLKLLEKIGRYEVVRLLGKGAFGKVFLANDPDLSRSVAIKVPTDKRVMIGGGVEEFLNEARAVAKLDHPNIVPVYDCGVSQDNRCFVVSKYVRGKELRVEIRKGIGHRESAEIVCQLARALHAAHVKGIVHRDVKPGNIIIDPKRRPHLLDFGLAFQEQDMSDTNSLIGTPAYMSPEQAEGGSHRVDGRSDIYSLAVVFYEMLTGHRPHKSEKVNDILVQLKLGEVRPPRQSDDTIPVELEEICLKALSRQLADRYNTAKDMADEIETYLHETSDDISSSVASGTNLFGSRKSTRSSASQTIYSQRHPAVNFLLAAGITVVVLVIIAVWGLITFTTPPWEVPSSRSGSDDESNLPTQDLNVLSDEN